MKTILVPLDLSAAAVQVCNAACALARQVGGRLVVYGYHVFDLFYLKHQVFLQAVFKGVVGSQAADAGPFETDMHDPAFYFDQLNATAV